MNNITMYLDQDSLDEVYPPRLVNPQATASWEREPRLPTGLVLPSGPPHSRQEIFEAVCRELDHQDRKWGEDKPQSLPGYIIICEGELQEARQGWLKNTPGDHSAMAELVQVCATAFRALQQYGTTGCPRSTNDRG